MGATSAPSAIRGLASVASKLDPSGVDPVSIPSTRRTLNVVPAGTVALVGLGANVTGFPAESVELSCAPDAFLADWSVLSVLGVPVC